MDSTADLYTGSNSGSFGNARKEQREAIVAEKRERKSQLTPAYDLVKSVLDSELALVKDAETFLVDGYVADAELNAELMARRRYIRYLKGLDAKFKQILVEAK